MKTIDTTTLSKITGGVRTGPNGEGCTGPFCGTKPRPRPPGLPRPLLGGDNQE